MTESASAYGPVFTRSFGVSIQEAIWVIRSRLWKSYHRNEKKGLPLDRPRRASGIDGDIILMFAQSQTSSIWLDINNIQRKSYLCCLSQWLSSCLHLGRCRGGMIVELSNFHHGITPRQVLQVEAVDREAAQ